MHFKTVLQSTILVLGLGVSTLNFAQVSPQLEQDFIKTFAQCDANFFKLIKKHKNELSLYAPIIEKGNIAYFDTGSTGYAYFKQPLVINNIELYAYYQQQVDVDQMASENDVDLTPEEKQQKRLAYQSNYFWGFFTNEPTEKRLARKLSTFALIPHGRLRYTQHDLIQDVRKSQQWKKAKIEWGYFPKPYTVERTMYIDGESEPVSLNCTMQGEVTPQIFKQIRPDL